MRSCQALCVGARRYSLRAAKLVPRRRRRKGPAERTQIQRCACVFSIARAVSWSESFRFSEIRSEDDVDRFFASCEMASSRTVISSLISPQYCWSSCYGSTNICKSLQNNLMSHSVDALMIISGYFQHVRSS